MGGRNAGVSRLDGLWYAGILGAAWVDGTGYLTEMQLPTSASPLRGSSRGRGTASGSGMSSFTCFANNMNSITSGRGGRGLLRLTLSTGKVSRLTGRVGWLGGLGPYTDVVPGIAAKRFRDVFYPPSSAVQTDTEGGPSR